MVAPQTICCGYCCIQYFSQNSIQQYCTRMKIYRKEYREWKTGKDFFCIDVEVDRPPPEPPPIQEDDIGWIAFFPVASQTGTISTLGSLPVVGKFGKFNNSFSVAGQAEPISSSMSRHTVVRVYIVARCAQVSINLTICDQATAGPQVLEEEANINFLTRKLSRWFNLSQLIIIYLLKLLLQPPLLGGHLRITLLLTSGPTRLFGLKVIGICICKKVC
ncbi:unnamed protein product [Cuscuta epithymum]|uniref:Uncharacterized protein n=1 Tax=Cuscuta epithymum TaxID=186058 RepID=A0AAV0GFE0_9ASTE|nr:unnamed protein product [Cuscuta epithymum]